MLRSSSIALMGALTLLLISAGSSAAPLKIPNTFIPGTPARAGAINENFNAVAAAVNTHEQRLTSLLSSRTGSFVVKVGATTLGTLLIDEINRDDDGGKVSVFNQKGFIVVLATGSASAVNGIVPSPLAEGSLFPTRILFPDLNCSGIPFVSFSPGIARQGVIFGNPRDLQIGYFAQGTPSPMVVQSVLAYVHPNSDTSRDLVPLGATDGTPFCVNINSNSPNLGFSFQMGPVLGIPIRINDPKITGVPNDLTGPITLSVPR